MIRKLDKKIRAIPRRGKEPYFTFYKILGFYPHNISLYHQAVAHKSSSIQLDNGKWVNNERLEFLGDAVLELVVSEFLYATEPQMSEGELTKLRAAIVCEPALVSFANELEFGRYVLLGKGEEQTGGRTIYYGKKIEEKLKEIHSKDEES